MVKQNCLRDGLRHIKSLVFVLDGDQRDLRRGKNSYRWSPGARAPAEIQPLPIGKLCEAGMHVVGQLRYESERKDLAAMSVAGELQIEWRTAINHRLMLKQDNEAITLA